jgi:hypothetical protein
MSFKVIIAGGRDFDDYSVVERVCDYYLQNKDDVEIVSGRADGADTLGEEYASVRSHQVKYFPANWKQYGASAGPRRNAEMGDYADALIAFWDGKSKGTHNMIKYAMRNGLRVKIHQY